MKPSTQPLPPDHVEKSNSTASLFLGGVRRNWMAASRPTSNTCCDVPPPKGTAPPDPELPEVAPMSPVTPGAMLPSAPVTAVTAVPAPKKSDPPTTALPSPVPSADSHPSPAISHPSAASPAVAAAPPVANPHPPPSPTSVTNEAGPRLPNQPGMTQVSQDSPGTPIARLSPQRRANALPQPMQAKATVPNGPSSGPDQLTWKRWQIWVEQVRRKASNSRSAVAAPRAELLYDACMAKDFFIWCCISSEWCQRGFGRVAELLENNNKLPKGLLVLFAQFPITPEDMKEQGWYQRTVQEVADFLPLLASRFTSCDCRFYIEVAKRRFPPLVHEMKREFQLNSPVFMSVIFASMGRQLYDGSSFLALNQLFKENLALERTGLDKDSHHRLIDAYRNIPMKGLPQQATLPSLQVPATTSASQYPQPEVTQLSRNQPSSASLRPASPSQVRREIVQEPSNRSQVPPNAQARQFLAIQSPAIQLSAAQHPASQPPAGRSPAMQPSANRPPPIVTVPYGHSPYQYPSQQVQQQPFTPMPPMPHYPQMSPTQQGQMVSMPPQPGHIPGYAWHPAPNPQTQAQQREFLRSYVPPSAYTIPNSAQQNVSSQGGASDGHHRENQVQLQTYQTYLRNQPMPSPHQVQSPNSRSPQTHSSSTASLLPPVGYRLPLSVPPNPMRLGLHQADLRDPIKKCVKKGPGGEMREAELYHYVSHFALDPSAIDPEDYNYVWNFSVSADDMTRRPRPVETSAKEGFRRILTYQSGCRTFRLRCIALPASEDPKHAKTLWHTASTTWPSVFYIHLNGREFTPRRKVHNGKDLPLDITLDLREGENKLQVDLLLGPDECQKIRYYFGIETMDVSRFDLVRSLVRALPAEIVREKIQKRLNQATDDDDVAVVTNNLSISLIDPFTAQICQTPARSTYCDHQECFDLETFIKTRKSISGPTPMNDNWKCPICNADARPQLLVLDRFLEDIRMQLIQRDQLEGAQSILIKPDGTWSVKATRDEQASREKTPCLPLAKRKADGLGTPPGNAASRVKLEEQQSPEYQPPERVYLEQQLPERIVIEID
ncbi:transcriptional regulator family: Zinc finger MIZ-type [Penicillium longicatenatum]|nr:transcriptional regulator family: Zinc finger MIZ-type [Penicillium longicatenatum]